MIYGNIEVAIKAREAATTSTVQTVRCLRFRIIFVGIII